MKRMIWIASCALAALGWVAGAGVPPAQAAGSPTRLILLGTQGGPRINADRAEPANLVVVAGTAYLVDAGNGVARQLALAHFQPSDIHQIFITHNHDDHNADWGTLMGLAWTNGNTTPITVHGPPGTESMLQGFLQYFAPNAAAHYAEGSLVSPAATMRAKDIRSAGLVYEDANIRVTAVENCHYHFEPGKPGYGWQKSYAFRFQTPDRVIVFSGDTGPCGHVLADFAKGADILVHEVIDLPAIEATLHTSVPAERFPRLMNHMRTEHSTPEEIGRVASEAGVRLVVLSHVVPGRPGTDDSVYTDGVKKYFSGQVVVGKDLMEF